MQRLVTRIQISFHERKIDNWTFAAQLLRMTKLAEALEKTLGELRKDQHGVQWTVFNEEAERAFDRLCDACIGLKSGWDHSQYPPYTFEPSKTESQPTPSAPSHSNG
jgi:hypothetical protein